MDCHDAIGRFSDLRDARLRGTELIELEQHLASCPACRQEWAEFSQAVEGLRSLGPVEPTPGFAARVRGEIEAPPWPRRLARRLFIPWQVKLPLGAAALVLLAIGTIFVYQRSPEMRQAVEQPRVPLARLPTVEQGQDATTTERPDPREAEGVSPKPQAALSTGETPKAREDHTLPRAEGDGDQSAGAAPSRQLTAEPVPKETPLAEQLEPEGAARPLAALTARPELTPFRIMTLRTLDVAAAEAQIRQWAGLVGGRSLDQSATQRATPAGERVLDLVVPLKAVPSLDALLAELGQLFGRELEVPPSNEVLISLTISPKPSGPPQDTE